MQLNINIKNVERPMVTGQHAISRVFTSMILAYFMLCLFAFQSDAQTMDSSLSQQSKLSVVGTILPIDLNILLINEGYSVELDKKGIIIWKIEGYTTLLIVNKSGDAIQFISLINGSNATLKKINQWNQTSLFSRSSLDDDGYAKLCLDLDLSGGVTNDRIKDYFRTCRHSFQKWIREVVR